MNNEKNQAHDMLADSASFAKSNLSRAELKAKRIDVLLESCKDQVLQQIIGPFGLTPAMFDDKEGGNVTTVRNFKEGVVANSEDALLYAGYKERRDGVIDRSKFDKDLPPKRKVIFQADEKIVSAYTGDELPRDGRMHLDHVVSVAKIQRDPGAGLVMSEDQRVAMLNDKANLVPAEARINQSMRDLDKSEWAKKERKRELGKTNMEHFGVDSERLKQTVAKAERHVNTELLKAQVVKQGTELAKTGMQDAGNNALRQATGILMYELVNGTFIEIKRISSEPALKEHFVEQFVIGIQNMMERIKGKLASIFDALISGGVQGFVSNLLSFIINNVIKTSAKVVTLIREGMKGLWQALKLLINPPPDMPAIEITRQVTKLIAAVVTASLGLAFEKTVEAFVLAFPLLAPFAGVISPALTAILTGVVAALVVFGIDQLFDWLNANGTEMLEAQLENMTASLVLFERMAHMFQIQFATSKQFQLCMEQYREIEAGLMRGSRQMNQAALVAGGAFAIRERTLLTMETGLSDSQKMDNELEMMMLQYEQKTKGA